MRENSRQVLASQTCHTATPEQHISNTLATHARHISNTMPEVYLCMWIRMRIYLFCMCICTHIHAEVPLPLAYVQVCAYTSVYVYPSNLLYIPLKPTLHPLQTYFISP